MKRQRIKRFRRQLTKGRLNLAAKNIVAKKAKDKTKRSPESSDSCCQVSHCSELSAAAPPRRCLLDQTYELQCINRWSGPETINIGFEFAAIVTDFLPSPGPGKIS